MGCPVCILWSAFHGDFNSNRGRFYPFSRRRYEMAELGVDCLNCFGDYWRYNQAAKSAKTPMLQKGNAKFR
jgi:hypothetical protein